MQESVPIPTHMDRVPTFYLTRRQRLAPGTILLAISLSAGGLWAVHSALSHSRRVGSGLESASASAAGAAAGASAGDDADDDPDQIDTIVLGDPSEAPEPAQRVDRERHRVSTVHPTILIHLPRTGSEVGMIPNSPAGHLLYDWLAAFNHADPAALGRALPTGASGSAVVAQMELRRETGGFNLITAKEVQPGVLVFRLLEQTPGATEALGTLAVRPDSSPPAVASFSLRSVPAPRR